MKYQQLHLEFYGKKRVCTKSFFWVEIWGAMITEALALHKSQHFDIFMRHWTQKPSSREHIKDWLWAWCLSKVKVDISETENGDTVVKLLFNLLHQLEKQSNSTEKNLDGTKTGIVTAANVKPGQIRHKRSGSQQLQHGKQETALSDPHSCLLCSSCALHPHLSNPISAYLSIRAPEVHRWSGRYSAGWKGKVERRGWKKRGEKKEIASESPEQRSCVTHRSE